LSCLVSTFVQPQGWMRHGSPVTSSEIPEDLASVARSKSAPERLPAQAGTSKIAPRVAVDDLFRRVPGQSSPPTLIQRVHAALPILRSYHTGGVVTLITTNVGFSGTRDHPFIHARLDWSISVEDQRSFGRGYSTIDSHGIADLAAQADARNHQARTSLAASIVR